MKSTREMIEVMEAYDRGEEIECSLRSGRSTWEKTIVPCWDWGSFDYRIKPKAQYRPWKPEEVPVGCLIRGEWGRAVLTHMERDAGCWLICCPDSSEHGRKWGLDSVIHCDIQHSTDGGKTWSPCGVKV